MENLNGSPFASKVISLKNNKELIHDLWDTPDQEKYKSLLKFYIKNSDAIVIGYDVTSRSTFEGATNFWFNQVKNISNVELIYMLGNKNNLINERNAARTEARNFCKAANIRYIL